MKDSSIEKALRLLGVDNPQLHKRTGWVVSKCPLGPWRHDGGESSPEVFGVKKEPGDPLVKCFSCGFKGSFGDLVFQMRHLNKMNPQVEVPWGEVLQLVEEAEQSVELDLDSPDIEEMLFGTKEEPHYFPDWWLESFLPWNEISWARDYLAERNVPASIAAKFDLRADTKQRRVCFPVRDFNGALVGLHGRAIDKETEPRYRMYTFAGKNNPIFWLGEHWVDLSKPLVVVEGPFDLASVYRVYRNVASPLFADPNATKILRMADALEIITFFDHGTGGDTGRRKFEKVLGKDHVLTHIKPPEGFKDPGSMSPEQIAELLHGLVKLDDFLVD